MDSNTAIGMDKPKISPLYDLMERIAQYQEDYQTPMPIALIKSIIIWELLDKEKAMVKDAFNFGGEYDENWDKAAEQFYHENYAGKIKFDE